MRNQINSCRLRLKYRIRFAASANFINQKNALFPDMNVSFNDLGPESRIWIYQSSRKLSPEEQQFITEKTSVFLTEWTAHGNELQAGVNIFYDRFIVLGVNEAVNEASGCSIDKSVHFMRMLGEALNLDFLDRSVIAIRQNINIELISFTEIKQLISRGRISADSRVFNNAITTKEELDVQWEQPITESWLKRYFIQNN